MWFPKFSKIEGRTGVLWGAGISAGVLLFAVIWQYFASPVALEDTFGNIVKKNEVVSQLRINLHQSGEMEKSAVMAVTDEESREFADQSLAAAAAVEQDLKILHALIEAAPLADEQRLVVEFDTCWGEIRQLDHAILELAVQNTNLKAASLSRGKGAEAMQRFEQALGEVARSHAGAASEGRVAGFADHALIAALKMYNLHSPHIAEASDTKMDQIETRMKAEENEAAKSLDALTGLAAARSEEALVRAKAAFAEFEQVSAEVIKLSRQNSNVKSLELSLGRKRKAAAQCDDLLAALQESVRNRTFKATR